MSNESLITNDDRGFIFTIEGKNEPVYQVDSKHWACEEHRWHPDDIPAEIRAKVGELRRSRKPGAFARFSKGGDAGVYVICEENITQLPEAADDDFVFDPSRRDGREKELSPGDIVICAKGGLIYSDNGDILNTEEGAYYVVKSETWGRFVDDPKTRPWSTDATKDFLILLEQLHGKNYLSMNPEKATKGPRAILPEPTCAVYHITCYVLNLARFERRAIDPR